MVPNTHFILVLKPNHDHEYTLVFQRDALIHESKTSQKTNALYSTTYFMYLGLMGFTKFGIKVL